MNRLDDPLKNQPDRAVSAILSSISDGVVALDNGWRFTHLNEAAERMMRCRAADVIGRTSFDALKVDAENPFNLNYLISKQTNTPVSFSAYSKFFDQWLEVRGFPHPEGYTIFFRDVSEERQAHRSLIEGQRSLQAARQTNQRIFETTLDLILVVDRQGNIVQVSPSTEVILGYKPAELVGHNAIEFLFAEDLERTRNEMRLARRGREMRNFETRYVHKNGRVVTLAWTGIWAESEQQHFFIGRDMTERIAAEERLRRAQRLESIGQLTGGIAHDFNNLLTVVIGSLDLLQDRLERGSQVARFAETALKASLRGANLTRQLLAFARRQTLDPKTVNFNDRVTGIIDILQRTLGEEIEIKTSLAPDLWAAFVDPAQLESAVLNLAINARDAMPGSGRLVIETANKTVDAQYVAMNIEAMPGDYVMLAVSDTGTGMPPEVVARAFEPFFTTKPTGQGTGLGLSMIYGFVRQSQGHVQIYSEIGHGTSVRLYLPRALAGTPAAAEAKAEDETMPRAKPGERILAVEDNTDVRRVVTAQLDELGYRFVEAANGATALAAIERGEPFDLLFTDVVMPGGMSGFELARAARKLRPELKVLLTSGFPKMSHTDTDEGREFAHMLIKPYRKSELAFKLRTAIDT